MAVSIFEERLKGGHHNSLGNTVQIVEEVLAKPDLFEEVFNSYRSEDELVRLRTSSGVKRVAKANLVMIIPYIDRLIDEVSFINQASTQWTLATLFDMLYLHLSHQQLQKAKQIMMDNLENQKDWIVLNTTKETLTHWSKDDQILQNWMLPILQIHSHDPRKSVKKRAQKFYQLICEY